MPVVVVVALLGCVIGVPFAFALILAAVPALSSLGLPDYIVPQRMFLQMSSVSFLAIPFFVITGDALARSGMAMRLVRICTALVGHLRGGLAQSGVLFSGGLAAVSGSGVANAATVAKILAPEMKKEGYRPAFTSAMIAAGAILGPLLPPSVVLVIYAGMTGLSVSSLFLAGVVPGLFLMACFMAVVAWKCRGMTDNLRERAPLREVGQALVKAAWALLAPAIIIGGILTGFFTATEAGAVAAVYVVAVWALVYRTMTWRDLRDLLHEAGITSAVVMLIVAAATVFAWMLGFTSFPRQLESFLGGLPAPVLITFVCAAILMVLGCVMDDLAAGIVLVPIIHPIAVSAGLDPLQFALVISMAIIVGGITPPVGIYLFITARATGVTLWQSARDSLPFLLVALGVLVVAIVWSPLTTWLPGVAGP